MSPAHLSSRIVFPAFWKNTVCHSARHCWHFSLHCRYTYWIFCEIFILWEKNATLPYSSFHLEPMRLLFFGITFQLIISNVMEILYVSWCSKLLFTLNTVESRTLICKTCLNVYIIILTLRKDGSMRRILCLMSLTCRHYSKIGDNGCI